VLEAFIEAPAGSLDTADYIAAIYEAFAPEAVLYVPETGSYVRRCTREWKISPSMPSRRREVHQRNISSYVIHDQSSENCCYR